MNLGIEITEINPSSAQGAPAPQTRALNKDIKGDIFTLQTEQGPVNAKGKAASVSTAALAVNDFDLSTLPSVVTSIYAAGFYVQESGYTDNGETFTIRISNDPSKDPRRVGNISYGIIASPENAAATQSASFEAAVTELQDMAVNLVLKTPANR